MRSRSARQGDRCTPTTGADRKVLFIDVDGTLVTYENILPASAVGAIRGARARGHRAYACTGRSKAEMYQDILDIGMDGMIGANGSYIEDGGVVVYHERIGADEERRLVDWLCDRGLCFYLESNAGLFASATFETDAMPALTSYAGAKGHRFTSVREAFPQMIFDVGPGGLYRDDVNKVSFVLRSYQDHLDSARAFPELMAGTWGGAGETALFGDLGVGGVTKAVAVRMLCDHLGHDVRDTIAFGDAKIDIPLFEACGQSCCMGSGGDEAKAAAGFVTDDVDKDGLCHAFEHFGLI